MIAALRLIPSFTAVAGFVLVACLFAGVIR